MREPARELLDGVDLPLEERRRALADLERVNRLLLGTRAVVRAFVGRLGRSPGGTLLDVAAGGGDATLAVARAAARRDAKLRTVALDRQLGHIVAGRGRFARGVVGDAARLPFRDRSFDWSLSTLFFHHLDRAGRLEVLAEMRRVTRRDVLVVDLLPAFWAKALARVLLPLVGAARVARLDGYASLRSSWSEAEWRELLREEGVRAELRRLFPARIAVSLPASGP